MLSYFITALVFSFALAVISTRYLIPKLKSKKMGQKILDIGPRWHKSKEGTPTMGGLAMIFSALVTSLTVILFAIRNGHIDNVPLLSITLGFALANGAIGFLDDYIKFFKKQNEGLIAWQKYLLQLAVAAAYLIAMFATGNLDTTVAIPFANISIDLGVAYYFFAIILLTGFVNSVNLADGIDGLASTETAVVGAFFAVASFSLGDFGASLLCAILVGCCLGFLVYNFHPAKIFMGDTGSLFLGGAVIGLAFMLGNPLIVVICGFMYILESISVILQVLCFKLTKKRLFKMAPIHHHFEKCGWSEVKIVAVFSTITIALCVVSYFGLVR